MWPRRLSLKWGCDLGPGGGASPVLEGARQEPAGGDPHVMSWRAEQGPGPPCPSCRDPTPASSCLVTVATTRLPHVHCLLGQVWGAGPTLWPRSSGTSSVLRTLQSQDYIWFPCLLLSAGEWGEVLHEHAQPFVGMRLGF